MSQYLGDLSNIETQTQYRASIEHFESIYQVESVKHIADLHPGYFSHQFACDRSESPAFIQHHHAHIASCLLENDWSLKQGKVLALALDGLGMGDDNTLWGAELMIADYSGYQRIGGIPAIKLLGGDKAAKQPWRSLYAHLKAFTRLDDTKLASILPDKPLALIDRAVEQKLNCHTTRSAGRLFDAIAASLNICCDEIEYEGQAACQLEALATHYQSAGVENPVRIETEGYNLKMESFWECWLTLNHNAEAKAWFFHDALARALAEIVVKAKENYQIHHLAITGGVFHNRLLRQLLFKHLTGRVKVLQHKNFSYGDGGLALGQLAIALAKTTHSQTE